MGTKNTLGDLNNILFEQLERLNDVEEYEGDKLQEELLRAKMVTSVASQIIANASVVLEAKKLVSDISGLDKSDVPRMLEG